MQIHELNNFNGTPGATNFLAIDDGSDTSRISGEALLDPVNSRIDNLTANVLPDSVETILDWADVESASKTLTKNVSGFDYLDLYFKEVTSGTNRIVFAQRYPRTAFPAQVTIPVIYWGGGTDPKYLYFQDLMIAISGTTLTMSQLRIYSWDGKAADGANIESGILVDQIRVDGVKISSNTSAELTDLRTAHNGTVYASARAAREADYNALDGDITTVKNAVINNGLQYKNIIGMEGGVLYPVDIPNGSTVTMSTADGATLGQSGLYLYVYDAEGNSVDYWTFSSGSSRRTMAFNYGQDIRFLSWSATPIKNVQVEVGNTATSYVPYNPLIGPRIDDINETLKAIKTFYNWFDPKDRYALRNYGDTANRNGITINNDGSISCTRYNNDYGQVMIKSLDTSKKLQPGSYVISAKVTINENITEASRDIGLRVGFSNAIQWITMKTERGGTTNTTEKVGWVSATFEITEEEIFAFEIIPRRALASADYPILFEEVMISNSSLLLPYSSQIDDAFDRTARESIKALGEIPSDALEPADIFNGEPYEGTYDWQTPVVNYGALFKGVNNVESFGFFTDPHVMGFEGRNEPYMHEYIKKVSRVFRSAACAFTVCGGDWLNNNTIADEACYRLGYIKALADNMLCGCKLVLGNHDTNYQGKADADSERGTGTLTNETVAALMFYDTNTRKAYYSFDGIRSKCYVLDTGIEHSTMLAYDWEQVDWLANRLREDDPDHAIIFLHIITNSGNVQTNTTNFASLVEAYNAHTTITLNSVAYDFSSCAGHVALWVGGHTHVDSTGTLGGIPYILTATLSYNSDIPLIDLVLVDYDNNVVKTIRVGGTGDNRTINLS